MAAVKNADSRTIDELIADYRHGFSLEQRFYTDPEVYDLELERVINRNWILAGHVSEFIEAGDFKVISVGRESAILVRGADGELRAFANVCRHRGSLVCLEPAGNAHRFACPYHGWTYDTQGDLVAARDLADGIDKADYSLKPVSCGIVHGLILIAFTDNPPSLARCQEELAAPMAMFGFEDLRVAAVRDYPIPANWKLAIENYQECYHCATAHPEYSAMHSLMLDMKKRPRVQKAMRQRMPESGVDDYFIDRIDTAAPPGEIGFGYRRYALFDGYQTGSREGKPVAPLLGEFTGYDGGTSDLSLGGFSFLLAYSDHIVAYVFTPVDHGNSNCRIYWLVRGDAEADRDFDVDELTWLWDVTTNADIEIIRNNARGISSRYYEPGPFAGMEEAEQNWVLWVLGELERP